MSSTNINKKYIAVKESKTEKTDSKKQKYKMDRMTEREKNVFALVRKGLTSKECAAVLKISVRTVEIHRANIIQKYQVKNLVELVFKMDKSV